MDSCVCRLANDQKSLDLAIAVNEAEGLLFHRVAPVRGLFDQLRRVFNRFPFQLQEGVLLGKRHSVLLYDFGNELNRTHPRIK